ncbi:MAG: dihydroorotate dehydrogenase electron transfer subunit [Christensenellales bacterium]|jgi:dihydroorotate dehydrogenase electron transfer subunit|nr:dihydroorotate dehydrogenase electron transfer subunit [Clostridiales bacterium]
MKKEIMTVVKNVEIADKLYLLVLSGASYLEPGQFLQVQVPGYTLRRPFCAADYDEEKKELSIIYKVLGGGTKAMTKFEVGQKIDVLNCLGHGFDLSKTKKPLLIGGGVGIVPLYYLAKELKKRGYEIVSVLGYPCKSQCFFLDEFKALGKVYVSTDDGSLGEKGNVLDILKKEKIEYDEFFACGPPVMLKALSKWNSHGQVSLESKMGCGFGACMGCSIKTTKGYKRVCKEGPVFKIDEVIFE